MKEAIELALQVGIGLAFAAYGLYSLGKAYLPKLRPASPPSLEGGPTPEEDRHTVLAIQGRLTAAGNTKAAKTAYTLIGEMLDPGK